jgi:hypothetical protein
MYKPPTWLHCLNQAAGPVVSWCPRSYHPDARRLAAGIARTPTGDFPINMDASACRSESARFAGLDDDLQHMFCTPTHGTAESSGRDVLW